MKPQDLDRIRFITRHFNDLQGLRYWVPLGLITLSAGGTTYFANRLWVLLRISFVLVALFLLFRAGSYYRRAFGEVQPQPLEPAADSSSLSIYSPAGPTPRLEGFQQVTPAVRNFLITMGLALALFSVFQAVTPTIMVFEDESLIHPPWVTLDAVFLFQEPWTVGNIEKIRRAAWPPSTFKAISGQMMYAVYGSFFLGLWLWRERRRSQSYHLALGVLLLGLSAFGTCLGYLVWEDRQIPRLLIDLFLPAVVHLWVALLLCGSSMILAGLLDHWQLVRTLGRHAVEEQP